MEFRSWFVRSFVRWYPPFLFVLYYCTVLLYMCGCAVNKHTRRTSDIISLRALRDVIMNNVTYYVVASSEHDGK